MRASARLGPAATEIGRKLSTFERGCVSELHYLFIDVASELPVMAIMRQHVLITAILFFSTAFITSASASGASGASTSTTPLCNRPWSDFQTFGKNPDPYKICFAKPPTADAACFASSRLIRGDDNVWTALRREQMKLIMSQEVSYASRFKSLSHDGIDHWAQLRERWRQRLFDDRKVLELDRSLALGRDRCALSMVIGIDCGNQPAIDILGIHQARAFDAEENRTENKVYPSGIAYELLRGELLLQTLSVDLKKSAGELEEANSVAKETLNSVLGLLPELAVDDYLRKRVRSVARRAHLFEAVRKMELSQLDMQQRLNGIDQQLKIFVSSPLTSQQLGSIEEEFFKAHEILLANLDSQIKRGRSDRDFIFEQDFLLFAFARHEQERGNANSAGLLQASICGNEMNAKESAQRIKLTKLGLATLGLATGVGAFFDVGVILSSVFVTTMSTSMIAVSALDVYESGLAASQARDLFALRAVPYSEWKQADDVFMRSIPWAVVNVAATAPIFALAKINSARRLAQSAGDVGRVARLERYHKATVGIAIAMGVGLTATQLGPAYEAAKELTGLTPARTDSKP